MLTGHERQKTLYYFPFNGSSIQQFLASFLSVSLSLNGVIKLNLQSVCYILMYHQEFYSIKISQKSCC